MEADLELGTLPHSQTSHAPPGARNMASHVPGAQRGPHKDRVPALQGRSRGQLHLRMDAERNSSKG